MTDYLQSPAHECGTVCWRAAEDYEQFRAQLKTHLFD